MAMLLQLEALEADELTAVVLSAELLTAVRGQACHPWREYDLYAFSMIR